MQEESELWPTGNDGSHAPGCFPAHLKLPPPGLGLSGVVIRSRIILALLLTSGLLIVLSEQGLPTAVAPSVPTPGYAVVENGLTLGSSGCDGSISMKYRMLAVDTAFAVKLDAIESNCTVAVSYLNYGDPLSTIGVAFVSGQVLINEMDARELLNSAGFAWDGLSTCPSTEYSNATTSWDVDGLGFGYDTHSYFRVPTESTGYCRVDWNAEWTWHHGNIRQPYREWTDKISVRADTSNVVACEYSQEFTSGSSAALLEPLPVCLLRASAVTDPDMDDLLQEPFILVDHVAPQAVKEIDLPDR